jgi:hypothetical protein
MRARFAAAAATACLVTVAFGCSQTEDYDASETGKVSILVSEVADASARDQSFLALFAATANPDKKLRPQYARFTFRPVDAPLLERGRATIKVLVRHARNDADAGEVEWTAIKEGDSWKLDQAPLPNAKGGA